MDEEEKVDNMAFNLVCVVLCILSGASAAGLTMGLLSLDSLKLKIKLVTGSEEEKANVAKLLPVLEDHHFLLCTLLIFNAVANEAMPIFLDALVPSWAAVLVSVSLVLVFGEVVPTATFTGPAQLRIVSKFVPLVRFLQTCLYPVARPMASALDYFLGHDDDDEGYSRDELSAMVRILRSKGADVSDNALPGSPKKSLSSMKEKEREEEEEEDEIYSSDSDDEEPLTANEVDVITGVLGLSKMTMLDIMTPIDEVNMVNQSQVFDDIGIKAVLKTGHSRLPVFKDTNRKDIVGIFLTKSLVGVDGDDGLTMASFNTKRPLVVGAGQTPLNALNLFQQGLSHIALVSHNPAELLQNMAQGRTPMTSSEPIGIVTLEDVIEAMIQSQIYDESDLRSAGKNSGVRNEDLFALAMSAATSPRDHGQYDNKGDHFSSETNDSPGLLKSFLGSSHRPTLTKSASTGAVPNHKSGSDKRMSSQEMAGLLDAAESGGRGPYSYHSVKSDAEGDYINSNNGGRQRTYSATTAAISFYKKYDGMFDSMGVPLIPPQDGAHKAQQLVASIELESLKEEKKQSKAAQRWDMIKKAVTADSKIRPSMINKYAKSKKYRNSISSAAAKMRRAAAGKMRSMSVDSDLGGYDSQDQGQSRSLSHKGPGRASTPV